MTKVKIQPILSTMCYILYIIQSDNLIREEDQVPGYSPSQQLFGFVTQRCKGDL